MNLTFFSCALDIDDKNKIINLLLDNLKNDLILFRFFEDKNLQTLICKKLDVYVDEFSKIFKTNLKFIYSFKIDSNKLNYQIFKKFLIDLNVFLLSCIYKLTCLTKSVILSYFFIIKKINYKQLFELTNIENQFQQKKWGYVNEQKKIDIYSIEVLKIFQFF